MKLEHYMVAQHLNKIEAGRPAELGLDPGHDRMAVETLAMKNSVALACMLFGLNKMVEIIDRSVE